MKRRETRNKIIYSIVSVLCFLLVFAVSYRHEEQQKNGCDIVALGDSILGECRDTSSVLVRLGELTGCTVFNSALGGTRFSRNKDTMRLSDMSDSLSVAALVQAIVSDDFGPQQTVRMKVPATDYFEVTIDSLTTVDFNEVETIIIEAGLNDYHMGITIASEDPYDEYTFAGALRSTLRMLKKQYPDIRIILLTPTYTWYHNLTCEEYNLGGGVLEDYVNVELCVAEEMGVEIIDLYHDFYPHEQEEDRHIYTRDGVHPNEAGRELIAQKLAEYF